MDESSRKSKRRRNRIYLLSILSGISVFPVIFLGSVSIYQFNRYIRRQLSESHQSRLEQVRSELEFQLDDINEAVNTLILATSAIELDEISAENITEYRMIEQVYSIWDLMETLKRTSRFIHSFYYLNSDGSFILSSGKEAVAVSSFSDTVWIDSLDAFEGYTELAPRMLDGGEGPDIRVVNRITGTRLFLTSSEGVFVVNIGTDERNSQAIRESLLRRAFLGGPVDFPGTSDSREDRYRVMINDYIRENYNRDISLENIADWMGISYSYLRKIFGTQFGMTFLEFIHFFRTEME